MQGGLRVISSCPCKQETGSFDSSQELAITDTLDLAFINSYLQNNDVHTIDLCGYEGVIQRAGSHSCVISPNFLGVPA